MCIAEDFAFLNLHISGCIQNVDVQLLSRLADIFLNNEGRSILGLFSQLCLLKNAAILRR